jgi:hypothetical protein
MFMLKALAPTLMAAGSIVLAIRVKAILDALALAVREAEANHLKIVAHIAHQAPLSMSSESGVHVDRCQRIGTGLLVTGFLLIAAGAILSGLVLYFAGF